MRAPCIEDGAKERRARTLAVEKSLNDTHDAEE